MSGVLRRERISKINSNLLIMADLVEKQILKAMDGLKMYNKNLVDEIIVDDDKVDKLHQVIEEDCVKLIATCQPVAKDLRNIFSASKVSTELERMADYAVDICKVVGKIKCNYTVFPKESSVLWEMTDEVIKMINLAVNAYVSGKSYEANKICKMDDKVDILYENIFSDMLKSLKKDEIECNLGTEILFIAKYIERIGDRVTNICEGIIYVKDGIYVDLNQ